MNSSGCNRWRQSLKLSNPAVSRSGPAAPNLVMEANKLGAGQTYTFRLVITTKNPAGTGEAEISFRVNQVRHAASGYVDVPERDSNR